MEAKEGGWTKKENGLFWTAGLSLLLLLCLFQGNLYTSFGLISVFLWGAGGKIAARLKLEKVFADVEKRAAIDEKTGVLTRNRFMLDFDREIKSSRRNGGNLSVIMIEAVNIMEINDVFDRKEGDASLSAIGLATQKSLRDTDYLGRVESLLFCALLTETNEAQCKVVLNRIAENIEQIIRSHSKGVVRVKYRLAMNSWVKDENPESLLSLTEAAIRLMPIYESSTSEASVI